MKKYILFTLIGLSLAGCGGDKKDAAAVKKAELAKLKKEQAELQTKILKLEQETGANKLGLNLELVSVKVPEKKLYNHYLEVQGKVESDQNIAVTAKAGGTVTAIDVTRGQEVRAGQVLVQIDDAVALQGMAELRTGLDLATIIYNKQKNLWDQKIGTEIQYLTAKNNKESLERKMATLRQQISMFRITSPINGSVDDIMPKLGEMATPGMPIVRVVNFDKMRVTADVSEAYITRIHQGDNVLLEFPDQNRTLKGNIRVMSRAINANNRTFQIEISLPGGDQSIRPNMIAIVKVNDYKAPNAMVIPINCVQKDDKGSFVFVAEKKGNDVIARKKMVKTGSSYAEDVEIKSGLSYDDKVITTGYQNVIDDQKIKLN